MGRIITALLILLAGRLVSEQPHDNRKNPTGLSREQKERHEWSCFHSITPHRMTDFSCLDSDQSQWRWTATGTGRQSDHSTQSGHEPPKLAAAIEIWSLKL